MTEIYLKITEHPPCKNGVTALFNETGVWMKEKKILAGVLIKSILRLTEIHLLTNKHLPYNKGGIVLFAKFYVYLDKKANTAL